MNILLPGGLPTEIEGVPIYPDFRNMLRFDIALHGGGGSEGAILQGLQLLYPGISGKSDEDGAPCPAPPNAEAAVKGLMWFYRRGESGGEKDGGVPPKRSCDFEGDAGMLYASFMEAYGISLTDCAFLHWWEFMALLESLPEETRMARAMYYRTVDTAGMSKSERARVMKMRAVFAIKRDLDDLTPEEREQRIKENVQRKLVAGRR